MYFIFPTHCITCPSGLMLGMKDETKDILCVVAVVTPSQAKQLPNEACSILGLWYRFDSNMEDLQLEERPNLVLFLPRGKKLPKVLSHREEIVIILYDQPTSYTYLSTLPLQLSGNTTQNEDDVLQLQATAKPLLPLPDIDAESPIEEIIDFINMTQEVDSIIKTSLQAITKHDIFQGYVSRFLYWYLLIPCFILSFISSISRFLMHMTHNAVFKSRITRYFTSASVLLMQFSLRLSQISAIVMNNCSIQSMQQASNCMYDGNKKSRMNLKRNLHQKQKAVIIRGSLITCIMLDVLLGIAVVSWLTSTNIITDMANYLLENTENVAQLLIQLIQWLMGVPAGLKLNKTLTNFLGKFFLYHIYLWQTYLKIIQPYLQTLLWICTLSGCLGMTFLITLASDVLSLLTAHIYCFYVYAARLYSLQVYTLLSLARLFTGKKWNILRSRVDSLPYDVDRLFIGTLVFTVILFLLPTTALFYVVFTSLRLMVYFIKFFLSSATHLLNKLPLFGIMLLFLRPSMLPGGLYVEILENFSEQDTTNPSFAQLSSSLPHAVSVLYLELLNKPLSVTQLVDWSIDAGQDTDNKQDTWGAFLGKLLRGHLVYPWIKRS